VDLTTLTSQLQGASATAGWDAICAINAENMNQLFVQWYLGDGPVTPENPVQLIFQGGESFYLLDAVLGPPEISFPADGSNQVAQVSMIVTSGVLLDFNPASSIIQSALVLQPDVASISGTVSLALMEGIVAKTDVVLQLGSGTYTPAISGVEATALQATALGAALQTYFAENGITFHIAGVTTSSVPACLQPTSFEFVVQPNPATPGDGCVLMLIQTNGTPGPVAPLTTYPIPDGSTAVLLVSNQVLFNQLFPGQLTPSPGANVNATYSGVKVGEVFQTSVTAGVNSLGVLSYPDAPGQPYSSNGKFAHFGSTSHESEAVTVSFEGLTIQPGGANLLGTYGSTWKQGWAYMNQSGTGPSYPGDSYETATTVIGWKSFAPVTVADPSTCIVEFPWSSPPACISELDKNLLEGFGQVQPGDQIVELITSMLATLFESLTAVDVDTFALQNLLFYPNQSLSLPSGSLPCDLVLVGSAVPALTVSPAWAVAEPGGPGQQFGVSLNGETPADVVWEISPRIGTISCTGLYTPPSVFDSSIVIKVNATIGNVAGSAMLLLYTPLKSRGLVVGPATLTMTSGQVFDFSVTDGEGNAVTVTWTLDPPSPGGGTMNQVFGTWQYASPETIATMTTVTLTATSTANAQEFGTATVTLVPVAPVTISPASTTVQPGQPASFTASTDVGAVSELTWLIYPANVGSIQASNGGSQATYTAPESVTGETSVQIVAYGVGGTATAAGIGIASVTVSTTAS
jgi:hypothetical protein